MGEQEKKNAWFLDDLSDLPQNDSITSLLSESMSVNDTIIRDQWLGVKETMKEDNDNGKTNQFIYNFHRMNCSASKGMFRRKNTRKTSSESGTGRSKGKRNKSKARSYSTKK